MITLLKITFISSFLYLLASDDCNLLPNGNYKFVQIVRSPEQNSNIHIETRVFIEGNNFSQFWDNGDSAKGTVKWIYDCTFRLDYLTRQPENKSELRKLLLKSFGDPCFELKEKKGDTIIFRTTYSGNLHVTTSEGLIIKIQ